MSKKEKALTRLVFYLFTAEGGFTNNMDFVCLLLILQGHDLYDFFRREYTRSLRDITKVDTSTKSLFLKEHGFQLFNKGLNRRLRNAIAHHDFKIDEEGSIIIDGREIDLVEKNNQLIDFMNLTNNSLKLAAKECFKWPWQRIRQGK